MYRTKYDITLKGIVNNFKIFYCLAINLIYKKGFLICISLVFLLSFFTPILNSGNYFKWASFLLNLMSCLFILCLSVEKRIRQEVIKIGMLDFILFSAIIYIFVQRFFLKAENVISENIIYFTNYILLFFVSKQIIYNWTDKKIRSLCVLMRNLVNLLLFSTCILGCAQILKIIPSHNHFFNVTGQFANPGIYATFISILLPFPLFSFIFDNAKNRAISGVIFTFAITILVITQSRSSFIGLTVLFIFVLILLKRTGMKIKLGYLIIVAVPLLMILLLTRNPTKFNSSLGRVVIWKISWNIIKNNAIFGIGYGDLEKKYMDYQAQYFNTNFSSTEEKKRAGVIRYVYNDLLHIQIEQGIIGLLLFVYFVYLVLLSQFRNKDVKSHNFLLTSSCAASVLVTLGCGIFSYPLALTTFSTIFFINCGIIAGVNRNHGNIYLVNKQIYRLFLFIQLCWFIFIFHHDYQKYNAYHRLKYIGYLQDPYRELNILHSVLKEDVNFINFYYHFLFDQKQFKKLIHIDENSRNKNPDPLINILLAISYEKVNELCKAEEQFTYSLNLVPYSFMNKYRLAKFYFNHNCFDKSKRLLYELQSQPIKIKSNFDSVIEGESKKLIDSITQTEEIYTADLCHLCK